VAIVLALLEEQGLPSNEHMLCCVTRYVRPELEVGPFDVKRKGSCRRVKNLGKAADGRDFVIKPYVRATVLAEGRRHCPSRLAEARNIPHLSCNYNGWPTPGLAVEAARVHRSARLTPNQRPSPHRGITRRTMQEKPTPKYRKKEWQKYPQSSSDLS
jgi:hypothetical protein